MEIERKFLPNPEYNIWMMVAGGYHDNIADYYFNPLVRLRIKNSIPYITIKSDGTIEREEFEYRIEKNSDLWQLKPFLRKERYYLDYENHTFEINLYNQYFHIPDLVDEKLCLIEVELNNKDEEVILPPWVGKEVTDDSRFYNKNLFQLLKEVTV